MDVVYGNVDAAIVVEETRKLYPMVDSLLEAQRRAIGISAQQMTVKRCKAEVGLKVGFPPVLLLAAINVIIAGISLLAEEVREKLLDSSLRKT